MDDKVLEEVYQERLEEKLINHLSDKYEIDYQTAMKIYYNSELAQKIFAGKNGVQYLDYKVLADILEETEPELIKTIK